MAFGFGQGHKEPDRVPRPVVFLTTLQTMSSKRHWLLLVQQEDKVADISLNAIDRLTQMLPKVVVGTIFTTVKSRMQPVMAKMDSVAACHTYRSHVARDGRQGRLRPEAQSLYAWPQTCRYSVRVGKPEECCARSLTDHRSLCHVVLRGSAVLSLTMPL